MSDRLTVPIVCAKAPRRVGCVPAVRTYFDPFWPKDDVWHCSFCGARVRVVA